MSKFIALVLLSFMSIESSASTCGLPPLDVENTTDNEIIIGFDLQSEEFLPIDQKDKTFKEFLSRLTHAQKVEANSSKQVQLSFGCGYGPSPKEFWFSYQVWGEQKQYVMKHLPGIKIKIE